MGKEISKPIKLVLFDIDGTMLLGKGMHPESYVEAFYSLFGVKCSVEEVKGPTDLYVIYKMMDMHKIPKDPENVRKIINKTTQIFKTKDLSTTQVLPGIEKLLESLEKEKNMLIGLATGNLRDIAFTKLRYFRLNNYFLHGGFGDSTIVRSDLIRGAVADFSRSYGKIENDNIYMIGDAPHDIEAAKLAGVKSLAVATNKHSLHELKKENPDYIFKDLSDTKKILDVIQNG